MTTTTPTQSEEDNTILATIITVIMCILDGIPTSQNFIENKMDVISTAVSHLIDEVYERTELNKEQALETVLSEIQRKVKSIQEYNTLN